MCRTLLLTCLAIAIGMHAQPSRAQHPVHVWAGGQAHSAFFAIIQSSGGFWLRGSPRDSDSGFLTRSIVTGLSGAYPHIFATDNLDDAGRVAQNRAKPIVPFVRVGLCAAVRPGLAARRETLLQHFLDPAIRLGMLGQKGGVTDRLSTAMFARAERGRAGASAALQAKANPLAGMMGFASGSADLSPLAQHLRARNADVILATCPEAAQSLSNLPGAFALPMPSSLAVEEISYVVILADDPGTIAFVQFLDSQAGRETLWNAGFDSPLRPAAGGNRR